MKMILYRIYQLLIWWPLLLLITILAAVVTIIGSAVGLGRFFGYHPAHWWARLFCYLSFVRVKVSGRENIDKATSYVFIANHQGAYDIFSIYGFLNHQFRWMMKKALMKIPLVGYSCKVAGHIYVDNSTPSATRATMATAEKQLAHGMSVVVFPEGSRSRDGKMHPFRRGAFMLATEFNLPVVPITINGSYGVMPRMAKIPRYGTITLTIHKPIVPAPVGGHDLPTLMQQSYTAIESALTKK